MICYIQATSGTRTIVSQTRCGRHPVPSLICIRSKQQDTARDAKRTVAKFECRVGGRGPWPSAGAGDRRKRRQMMPDSATISPRCPDTPYCVCVYFGGVSGTGAVADKRAPRTHFPQNNCCVLCTPRASTCQTKSLQAATCTMLIGRLTPAGPLPLFFNSR